MYMYPKKVSFKIHDASVSINGHFKSSHVATKLQPFFYVSPKGSRGICYDFM